METTLDAIKFGVRKIVDDQLIRPNVEITREALLDTMPYLLTITGRLLGQQNLKEIDVTYPADWWQAVKQRFAPKWFLRRWPVVYQHVNITVGAVYPELHKKLKLPDEPHNLFLSSEWHKIPGSEI